MASQNLTVRELAEKSGIHYVMINRYLKGDRKGKVPSIGTLVALAETLSCSLDDLVGFEVSIKDESAEPTISETAEKVGKFFDGLEEGDTLKKLLKIAIENEDHESESR